MLQMVHGASDITVRAPRRWPRWSSSPPGDTSGARMRASWSPPTPSSGPSSTGCAAACAVPTCCRIRPTTCVGSAARWPAGQPGGVAGALAGGVARRAPTARKALLSTAAECGGQTRTGQARLTAEAARDRLTMLGYRDPAGALRHLQSLSAGVSRRAAIQRTLLPVMLGWFAAGPDPDAGLLGFRRVSDAPARLLVSAAVA